MRVSLIVTVLNEGDSIRRLLDSIAAQRRPPDEVIICDGGSSDNTLAVLADYQDRLPLTVVVHRGANISEGRNAAIQAARHDLIAVTDAGVRLDPDWLKHLVEPFERGASAPLVAGFFLPDAHTAFEVAMGATVLPEVRDVNPAAFLPSSRSVAFRREAWEAVGGYPEWIDVCEDLIFDFRVAACFGPFVFAPQAVAYFRPRPTLRAFLRQYYLYARGDGKANLFPRRHLIRYLTYFAILPLILLAGLLISPWWLLALFLGGGYMVATPYRRLLSQWGELSAREKLLAALWVPVIRVAGDWAKMAGYPAGRRWRRRNHPPDWRLISPPSG
jgi:glycosyltransferase involved in cell wall biosynthesis